jgi:transposase InsO family protein
MDIHKNARLSWVRREELAVRVIQARLSVKSAAADFMVSARTAAKWVSRYREQGREGLYDRSSRPHRLRQPTPAELVVEVERLRRQRRSGVQISVSTGLSRATVSRILRRLGLNRMRDLEPRPEVVRYEHASPGDLLHLDIKKISRFAAPGLRVTGHHQGRVKGMGWEYLHVAIDDHSRLGLVELHANQKGPTAAQFLRSAVGEQRQLGITVRGVLTDNGPCYRSASFRQTCRELGIQQRFTRPYTPRTNGKAERFILTTMREWAWARAYENSQQRAAELPRWNHYYNWHRPHASLNFAPPISRAGIEMNNLLTHYT